MQRKEAKFEDLKTLKTRSIKLRLSDEDTAAISIEAALRGFTVSELLENFIADLTDGVTSNGSDERRLAEEYAERVAAPYCYANIINALVEDDFLIITADNIQRVEQYKDSTDITEQMEAEEAQKEIEAVYSAYKETYGENAQTLQEALQSIENYIKDYTSLQADSDPFIAYLYSVYATLKAENEKEPGSADEKIKLLTAVRNAYLTIKEG